ncbi:MAG: AAA family ATPase, partial [Ilumatobacteraceae bacterium]
MTDSSTATSSGTTSSSTRLPLADLPATVLPGAVITLALVTDQLRRAVEGGPGPTGDTDRRILLRADDDQLAVVAQVPDIGSLPTGEPVAIVRVEARARIGAVHTSERGATYADADILRDPRPTPRVEALARELRGVLEPIAQLRRSRRLPDLLRSGLDPGALADGVATWAEFDEESRREVLAAVDVGERVQLVLTWARDHLAELQVAETIRHDVTEGVDKQQREYLLRQQLAAIRKELGEGDDDVVGEYRTKLETLEGSDAVRNFVAKEIDRLERTSAQSPEQGWIRTWLDRVFELPWGTRSSDSIDLDAAQAILDADHYGLADVKSRIVEFLAVKKLVSQRDHANADREPGPDASAPDAATVDGQVERRPEGAGPPGPARQPNERSLRSEGGRGQGSIITLVGPPGVGKTSLGESIASAMGRKFVRVALGGVRDEAEIRGHRRTYVGAQPGRIVKALTEAGTMNPVILLDEVDKLGAGAWSGDPTAALLEVLDPAQNHTFRDHYLELDLDLSEVVFIATANVLDTVPAPLLDRMDIIRLDGYTDEEKVFIARRYLLPRQLKRAGLGE